MWVTREDQARAWKTPEWKQRTKELLSLCPRCEYCNGSAQVINHKPEGYQSGYDNYLACHRHEVDVICNDCHKHYTKSKGKKRGKKWNDCEKCGKPAEISKTICVNCASGGVLERCPLVRIGDIWENVWLWTTGDIKVLGFEKQKLAWVLVKTDRAEEGVGLPAFIEQSPNGAPWARLKKAGRGKTWKAWLEK